MSDNFRERRQERRQERRLDNLSERVGAVGKNLRQLDRSINNTVHETSDVDVSRSSQHHTLGYGPNQAASGDHHHKELVLHLKDFGVVGDKITDDTAAIQRAVDFLKSYPVTDPPASRPLFISGFGLICRVEGSIDLTGIVIGRGWGLRDFHIVGYGNSNITLDFTASRFGILENVRIWGDQTNSPHTGIALAKSATAVMSHFTLINVTIDGYFLDSSLHLKSSEEQYFSSCMFVNRRVADVNGDSFAVILDGKGSRFLPSQYQTPSTTRSSFTVNRFSKCSIQKPFGIAGPAMFMEDVASITFESCYGTSGSNSLIEWWLNSDFTPYRVHMDFQVETTGINRFIWFRSSVIGIAAEIRGLEMTFGNVYCNSSLIDVSNNINTLSLKSFKSHLYRLAAGVVIANGIFSTAATAKVSIYGGDIVLPSTTDFKTPSSFPKLSNVRVLGMNGSILLYEDKPAYALYTPVVSAPWVINDGVITGHYRRDGRTTYYRIRYTVGATDVIGGNFIVSLPTPAFSGTTGTPRGTAVCQDTSVPTRFNRFVCHATSTTVYLADSNDTRVGATVPFTFAVGDVIDMYGSYEDSL